MMLAPEVETLPWDEQLALDDESYREQLAYLYERSAFYREKLGAAGIASPSDAGGLEEIAALPLTEKHELKETTTEDNPVGTHLCATRDEIVRIYSTSGTTGTPSYIPLTAGDLEAWVLGSARSYAASGIARGQRIVSTYNAGPFVAGAALAAFDLIGLCHIPVGTGNTERLLLAIERLEPEAAVLTPSYGAYLVEAATERGVDLRGSTSSACSSPASRAEASRRFAPNSRTHGVLASRRRWGSVTSASHSGASARNRTACISVRADSSTRSSSIPRPGRLFSSRTVRAASSS